MTIEERLEKLTSALETLTAVILNIPEEAKKAKAEQPTPEPAPVKKTKEKAAGVDSTTLLLHLDNNPKDSSEPEPGPTIDELRDLCLALVRKDRTTKDKIAAIVKKYDGMVLQDVDPIHYIKIKAELEAIQ